MEKQAADTRVAVIYARVSGDDRNNATSSLDSQLEQCREYAQSRGWHILEELAEDSRGASGATFDLPQLNTAIQLAREGKFDILVTREMDRLARGLAKQLIIEQEFERCGVEIDYVIGDYQSTPEGQLSKHIRAVVAEYEREKIRERMVRGRRQKARAGYVVLHGNAPFGYNAVAKPDGTQLEIDEAAAQVVKMIFDWYTVEKWGTSRIARELNRREVLPPSAAKRTKSPRAVQWNQAQVSRILKNETYAGTWHYGKRSKKGKNPSDYRISVEVPAIVTPEIFAQAQRQRVLNSRNSKRNTRHEYLMRRRCSCGECASSMLAFTKHGRDGEPAYSYYRCQVPHTSGTHYMTRSCSMTKHFRVDYWDQRVWQAIRDFVNDAERLELGFRRFLDNQEDTVGPLRNRIAVIDDLILKKSDELSRLLELYLSGTFDQELLHEHKRRLEQTISKLRTERESIRTQLDQYWGPDQAAELQQFIHDIRLRLPMADKDFSLREQIVDSLGATTVLTIEDGVEVCYLTCDFGLDHRMSSVDPPTQNPFPPLESARSASSHAEAGDNCSSIDKHSMDCRRS